MRIKDGFELRDVCGENVIIAVGMETIDFSKIISINESAAFVWKTFLGKDFSEDDVVEAICNEYDVAREVAATDIKGVIAQWSKVGLID